jgi:hypothetical protein
MRKNRKQFEAFQKMECPLEWALHLNSKCLANLIHCQENMEEPWSRVWTNVGCFLRKHLNINLIINKVINDLPGDY